MHEIVSTSTNETILNRMDAYGPTEIKQDQPTIVFGTQDTGSGNAVIPVARYLQDKANIIIYASDYSRAAWARENFQSPQSKV